MDQMLISRLAETAGLSASTLRYYDSKGLLPSERTAAGYRTYGPRAVERLAFIGAAKNLGLPLDEIAQLLDVWQSGACAEVKADLRPRLAARLSDAEARGRELAEFTASLRAALAHLDSLPDRAERCDPECGFLTSGSRASSVLELSTRPAVPDADQRPAAPIACGLDSTELAARTALWREIAAAAEGTAIRDGARLTLPVERAGELTRLAVDEQRCCPFFDFRMRFDGPRVHLEISAPSEARALLEHMLTPAA
jgi:DNA-binding transcriptional MerR regulator